MRWIKHMTGTMDDERISAYFDQCGLEGYGFYWLLLEVIAKSLEKDSTEATLTYPASKWARALYSHPNRVSKHLGSLQVHGLVTFKCIGSDIKVNVPKLLKYRDEYSRKSGHGPEIVPPKIQIQRESSEADVDTDKKQTKKSARTKAGFVSPAQASAFADFWAAYWLKKGKEAASKAYRKKVTTTGLHAKVMAAVVAQAPEMLAKEPGVRPHGATWINGKRWEDEIESGDLMQFSPTMRAVLAMEDR